MRKQSGLIPTMPWLTNTINGQGRYEEAIKACEQAIRLNLNDVVAYSSKGSALYSLGCYKEAIEVYEQAVRLNPDDARTHNDKGDALNELGCYEEAIEAYEEA